MLSWIGGQAAEWARLSPWTNVYGISRSLLALGTLMTLVLTPLPALFSPTTSHSADPVCLAPASFGIFCLMPRGALDLARIVAVALLALTATGWRPRLTAVPHWWVSFSLPTSASVIDGGDHVTQVLTLLLLPVALTDARPWHWSRAEGLGTTQSRLVALSCLLAIRVQVAGIYAQSSIAKLSVPEWIDGTVMYYWLTDPMFGAPAWLQPLLTPVITTGAVALITWSALALEFALVLALVAGARIRSSLLVAGILFHTVIAIVIGLVSFGFAMSAALILYLRPVDRPFRVPSVAGAIFAGFPRGSRLKLALAHTPGWPRLRP
jgi:antimicrobial peptide system SdpB family protein